MQRSALAKGINGLQSICTAAKSGHSAPQTLSTSGLQGKQPRQIDKEEYSKYFNVLPVSAVQGTPPGAGILQTQGWSDEHGKTLVQKEAEKFH